MLGRVMTTVILRSRPDDVGLINPIFADGKGYGISARAIIGISPKAKTVPLQTKVLFNLLQPLQQRKVLKAFWINITGGNGHYFVRNRRSCQSYQRSQLTKTPNIISLVPALLTRAWPAKSAFRLSRPALKAAALKPRRPKPQPKTRQPH